MSHREKNNHSLIIDAVIAVKGGDWNAETHKVVRTDALRILEALVAEHGVDGAVEALDRQGFEGNAYKYLLTPLVKEARFRRPPTI